MLYKRDVFCTNTLQCEKSAPLRQLLPTPKTMKWRQYVTPTCVSIEKQKNGQGKKQARWARNTSARLFALKRLRDLLLSSSLYGCWLSNFQLKSAFRSRLLGFVFKLECSLCTSCILEIYRFPRTLPTLTPEIKTSSCATSFWIEEILALLFFTVTYGWEKNYQNIAIFDTRWSPR